MKLPSQYIMHSADWMAIKSKNAITNAGSDAKEATELASEAITHVKNASAEMGKAVACTAKATLSTAKATGNATLGVVGVTATTATTAIGAITVAVESATDALMTDQPSTNQQ